MKTLYWTRTETDVTVVTDIRGVHKIYSFPPFYSDDQIKKTIDDAVKKASTPPPPPPPQKPYKQLPSMDVLVRLTLVQLRQVADEYDIVYNRSGKGPQLRAAILTAFKERIDNEK